MPTTSYSIPSANGQYVFQINGAPGGLQQLVVAAAVQPSAGTVAMEYQLANSTTWVPIPNKGVPAPLTAPAVLYAQGAIARYRVTIAGLGAGTVDLRLWVSQTDPVGFPDGAFTGLRALTIQSYTEANVKNGVQFEASAFIPALTGGANHDTRFTTGAKPVIIKARQLGFDGDGLTARVFRAPTTSGGVAVPVYNLNDINPVATTIAALSGVTTTVTGTEIAAPTTSLGSDLLGISTQGTYAVAGAERILRPNTAYLLRLTNLAPLTAERVAVYLSWYEGDTDLPL